MRRDPVPSTSLREYLPHTAPTQTRQKTNIQNVILCRLKDLMFAKEVAINGGQRLGCGVLRSKTILQKRESL